MLSDEHEAMIIVANHSHIRRAGEHNGQSTVFKNPLSRAQNASGKCWYCYIFNISLLIGIKAETFDNPKYILGRTNP